MSATENKAVFLSYASQDAEAARKICESLRSGGVEVWFDVEGGLEHGDEWDAKIRKQIKECVLFIAVISANTQAREEGYFRLEWDLAAERARTIASGVPFILPVVIDDTREPDALVPDRFRTVQWTRFKGGEVPPEVRARFLKLWSHRTGLLKSQSVAGGATAVTTSSAVASKRKPTFLLWSVALAAVVLAGVGAWWFTQKVAPPASLVATGPASRATVKPPAPVEPPVSSASSGLSEARQLLAKTTALTDALDNSRDDYKLAEELIAQAKSKDPLDAEVWATEARLHESYLLRGWDVSDARREAARAAVQRAIRLDPQSFAARLAQAGLLADTGREGAEKERQLRELRAARPKDQRVLRMLAAVVDRLGRMDESAAIADESAALPGGDPLALYSKSLGFWFAGRTAEAEAAIQASLAQQPFTSALLIAAWYRITLHGDPDGARDFIQRIEPAQLIEDRAAFFAYYLEFVAGRPDAAIARLQAVPRDWLNDFWYRGPKGWLVGDALELGGRHDAAVIEWTAALKLVEQRLAASPNTPALLYNRIGLLLNLGRREEAEREFSVLLQMRAAVDIGSSGLEAKCHALLGHKVEAIRAIAAGLKRPGHAVVFPSGVLRFDPIYRSLRAEPEFAQLIAEAEALERAPGANAPKTDLTATAPARTEEKSVAVLAFANLSDDKANEYFSDGISEELINALGKVPGLKVPARTSSFYFKGKSVPVPEIAQQLSVAYVIEGSVQRAGDKVKIGARLTKAADGFQVWSDSFTREAKDIFAVEEEIAGMIAQALSLKLGVASAAAKAEVDPEAFRLYIEGRREWNRRLPAGYARAEQLLTRAIQLAPGFAQAHAALADVWELQGEWDNELGPYDQRDGALARRVRAKAREALSLDPQCAEAHASLGLVAWNSWRFAEGEEALRTALRINPSYASAHQWLGRNLMVQGRLEEALAALKRAAELDPLSPRILDNLAWALVHAGRPEEALAALDKALALQPDALQATSIKAQILARQGRRDEAMALIRTVPPGVWISSHWRVTALGLMSDAKARGLLESYLTDRNAVTRFTALLFLGREEEALRTLVPGQIESTRADVLLFDPIYDRVRADAAFTRALATIGLTEAHARAQAWRAAHLPKTAGK